MHDPETVLNAAVLALRQGELVVYPTETLYGLGADARSAAALKRLVEVKGREPGKPISVLIDEVAMLEGLVAAVPPLARALIQRFWPGPLTLVLEARANVPTILTGGPGGGIGARVSSHPLACELVRRFGGPITTPSANPAGLTPPRRVEEARAYFGDAVRVYVGDESLPGEPASTVLDVRGQPRLMRAGAVSRQDIELVIGVGLEV